MRGSELLLALALFGILLRLHLLLRLEARYLLRDSALPGRIGNALAGAAFLLPLTRLEIFAMPISATMTTSAMTTGILFRNGGFASGCSGTVAGGF